MNLKLWVALGTLLPALAAQARQPSRTPDPADPSVAVPATVYQPVLGADAPPAKDLPTPDKSWRAANDAVAGPPGHARHAAASPAPAPAPGEAKAKPPAPPAAHDSHTTHH